jgi:branched-subunit amino acid transport protein
MTAWTVILAVGLGTYMLRLSMFVLLAGRTLPAWTTTPMSLVAPAAVAALVATMLFVAHDGVHPPDIAELVGVGAGFAAVRRTGNVVAAFVVGLPVFWLMSGLV